MQEKGKLFYNRITFINLIYLETKTYYKYLCTDKYLLTLNIMEANEKKEHYIREHMKAAGVGVVELSRRLGLTRQNVRIQIDKSSITLQTLHRIAAALDIEAYRLLLPPEETQHKAGQATDGRQEATAAHRQEEARTRPGIYTRCICPHCHGVLRLMADE